jgi:hypothetical protein
MCCVPWAAATNWRNSLRMTIGRWTTEEIDYAVATIKENVAKLRDLPLWEMFKMVVTCTIQWAGKRGIQALNQSPYSR